MTAAAPNAARSAPLLDASDERVVLTLDAGGTNFAFSALQGGRLVGTPCVLPSCADDLDASLDNLVAGFERVAASVHARPVAISFAFPGPADFPNGVVFNVGNLPAYRDGVAVAAFLEDRFGLPTFLNNDGDLFALGEATAGLLPHVNRRLAEAGSTRRCRNLFAVTLGTGLGGGAVVDGRLLSGDNSAATEVWRLPSALASDRLAEEDASIRAVRRAYATESKTPLDEAPTPADIAEIAHGRTPGDRDAACGAFARLGEAVGGTIATATCFLDALVVIGGGLSGAADLFMPALCESVTASLRGPDGTAVPRVPHKVFDLRTDEGLAAFGASSEHRVAVPRGSRTIACQPDARLGVGVSLLGANHATAVGAYAYALQQIHSD
ncbi:ROK family protein [Botrimarina sp.]|uniref:ROK family protein n=1 Tax=Botrimarina sp. TaxID=2795802 RepID=UPI0032EF8661